MLEAEAKRADRRALAQLLDVGDDVVVRRGYEGARVEDVVAAAGVSRGAFYRYFDNIESFVRVIAVRGVRAVSEVVAEPPDVADRASLRRWLRRYDEVHSAKGPMIRVWVEAVGEPFRGDHAAVFDWGRRRMARLLAGRSFGDADLDGLLLLAMVEAFGSEPRSAAEVDAAVRMVERGFLGRDPTLTSLSPNRGRRTDDDDCGRVRPVLRRVLRRPDRRCTAACATRRRSTSASVRLLRAVALRRRGRRAPRLAGVLELARRRPLDAVAARRSSSRASAASS